MKAQDRAFVVILFWFDSLSRASYVFILACGKVICAFCFPEQLPQKSVAPLSAKVQCSAGILLFLWSLIDLAGRLTPT